MYKPCILVSSALKRDMNSELEEELGSSDLIRRLLTSPAKARDKRLWALIWMLKSAHAKVSKLLVNAVYGLVNIKAIDINPLPMLMEVAQQSGDGELKGAVQAVTRSQVLVFRLLEHGADPIIKDTTPSMKTALDMALESRHQDMIFLVLNSVLQRTEFSLSLAKTAKEKSEILHPITSHMASLIYRELADLNTDHVLSWLILIADRDRNFVLASIKALETYTDGEGSNAMHVAALNGHARAVGIMIYLGLNKDILDSRGRSPADLALANKRGRASIALTRANSDGGDAEKRRRAIWSWDKMKSRRSPD
jgi:hypothetical protein